jgi:nucleoside 2-deoxyribosyltransferase
MKKYSNLIIVSCVLCASWLFAAVPDLPEKDPNNKTHFKNKIYCAGPLFNKKEHEEMLEIAQALEQSGFSVFLPYRDGILLAEFGKEFKNAGFSEQKTNDILLRAIFCLDVYHVLDSEGLLLNMNGRVPDEGALIEAGMAWDAGKTVVIYKTDIRTLVDGKDNPMILGLSDFKTVKSYDEIVKTFLQKMNTSNGGKKEKDIIFNNQEVKNIYDQGEKISRLLQQKHSGSDVVNGIIEIIGKKNL